jgi:uncharacterized damage-inducible protein DinB
MTVAACAAPPPPPPPPPSTAVVDSVKANYEIVKRYVTATVEQVPENRYAYQPTKEVRTMGQLLGHIADANYLVCGYVSGEPRPEGSAEGLTAKADMQKTVADSFAYCDRAYTGLNDTTGGAETVMEAIGNMKTTKLGALAFSTTHSMEHYGNLVTYMR